MKVQHTIIVQIGSSWESCSWSLIFWAPNSGSGRPPPRGYQVHFAQAVASTWAKWRSTTEPWSSTTAAARRAAWNPKHLGGVFGALRCAIQICSGMFRANFGQCQGDSLMAELSKLRILALDVLHLWVPSPLRPGGGLYVWGMMQHNGTMEFHNCSSERSGVEPQGSGWSFLGLPCKIMQNPNLDTQSQWGVWFFSLMMCVYCYSFWSTECSRFWFLLYAFVMFEEIWPLKKADSICLWKLLSCPAQVECQKEHWVVKMMAANHCLISIGVKKQSESQHHGLFVRLFGALKLFRSKGGSAWFTQLWRLVLWQFLQLLPMNVHRIIVQIGSSWESCSWSLIFWAPNSGSGRPPPRGYQVHFAQAVASTSTRTWRSKREPWSSTTAAAGTEAWSPKDLGGGFRGFDAKNHAKSKFGCTESVRSVIFLVDDVCLLL